MLWLANKPRRRIFHKVSCMSKVAYKITVRATFSFNLLCNIVVCQIKNRYALPVDIASCVLSLLPK